MHVNVDANLILGIYFGMPIGMLFGFGIILLFMKALKKKV